MQSYKTLITKRYFGRIKVRHIASASVGADVCVGRCGCLRRSMRMTKVGSMKRKRNGVKREKKSVKRKKEGYKRGK